MFNCKKKKKKVIREKNKIIVEKSFVCTVCYITEDFRVCKIVKTILFGQVNSNLNNQLKKTNLIKFNIYQGLFLLL